jgi:hypothetical protein
MLFLSPPTLSFCLQFISVTAKIAIAAAMKDFNQKSQARTNNKGLKRIQRQKKTAKYHRRENQPAAINEIYVKTPPSNLYSHVNDH